MKKVTSLSSNKLVFVKLVSASIKPKHVWTEKENMAYQ